MKFRLSTIKLEQQINNINSVLQTGSFTLTENLHSSLLEAANRIKEKAQEILLEKVTHDYSDKYGRGEEGNLSKSIEVHELQRGILGGPKKQTSTAYNVSVGPNMTKAPYAEWVEIGHYMTGPNVTPSQKKGLKPYGKEAWWWEGYHYMEGAWAQEEQNISRSIRETLATTLVHFGKGGKGLMNVRTGKAQKGKFGL